MDIWSRSILSRYSREIRGLKTEARWRMQVRRPAGLERHVGWGKLGCKVRPGCDEGRGRITEGLGTELHPYFIINNGELLQGTEQKSDTI